MDPLEKELNPSPNLPEVYGEEPLVVDKTTKVHLKACQNPPASMASLNVVPCSDDSMKVFLRIRPLVVLSPHNTKPFQHSTEKLAWPKLKPVRGLDKKKKTKQSCIQVCDPHTVSITPPCTLNRMKCEVYRGFSHVFSSDSSQEEVYAKVVSPLVEDFLGGKSGLLVASGPSGSGKTHTMFGTAREPGLVPLALRRIFHPSLASQDGPKRSFHLSIFEIYADNGKTEKLSDLSPDGGDVQLQQSGLVKGLKELHIPDYVEAEALIARALLRRNIGMTNSNSQSSRSQCIIRIRCAVDNIVGKVENQVNESVLTFVDLAGAEKEKKTGNQGIRLLESSFINKTSMVFGLCLKSLLEHQKNPKKPLRKHFQSSLLTRYLRDYLEGKKRMALILTVRPAEEDYLDTSFLLRQASPCMEIKFLNKDETSQNKRQYENMYNAASEQSKRIKTRFRTDSTDKVTVSEDARDTCEAKPKKAPVSKMKDEIIFENVNADSGKEREYKILSGFAKSIWMLLKQHNQKIKVLEKHNVELQKEINDLKSSCACKKEQSLEIDTLTVDTNSETRILSKELVGDENAASDPGGKKDEPKGMEKQIDICNKGCDGLEEQNTDLKYRGDKETGSISYSSEALLQLPEDHIAAFPEAIHNEMVGEGKDDVKVNKQTDMGKPRYNSEEEEIGGDLVCKGESEAVELVEEPPLSAFHEPKLDEMVRQVEYCQSGNMSDSAKKTDICETEAKHPFTDCDGVLDVSKEMEKQAAKHNEAVDVEDCQPSNVIELDKSRVCETEPKHTQDECCPSQNFQGQHLETKETSSGSNEKMPKCSSNLSNTIAPKSDGQSSTRKKGKQKTYVKNDQGGNKKHASDSGKSMIGGENLSVKAKPKRRLMPASSVLLRHVNNLGFEDEGLGGGIRGRSSGDDNTRTTSNASLLRLLKVDARR